MASTATCLFVYMKMRFNGKMSTTAKFLGPDPSGSGSTAPCFLGMRVESHWGHGFLYLVNIVCCQVVSLRQADHSSRGILPSVVCLSVIVKPR